jgi:hypothetical protein
MKRLEWVDMWGRDGVGRVRLTSCTPLLYDLFIGIPVQGEDLLLLLFIVAIADHQDHNNSYFYLWLR